MRRASWPPPPLFLNLEPRPVIPVNPRRRRFGPDAFFARIRRTLKGGLTLLLFVAFAVAGCVAGVWTLRLIGRVVSRYEIDGRAQ